MARTKKAEKGESGEPPTVAVKVERGIAVKARMIATDRGIPLANYISDALRSVVDKDWGRMVRRVGTEPE